MPVLFGKRHSREELLRRIGNTAQIAGIREYTYSSGRADGVKAAHINNGLLTVETLPGRCLDIASLSYKGIPAGYYSKSGLRHPAYFAKTDPTGFHANFLGGVLTTCGLLNIGPAANSGERMHPLHGELSAIPAEKIAVSEQWDGDECIFHISGEVRHAAFYHEDLVLRRRISTSLGSPFVSIEDEVENCDFAPVSCLLLYHIQFGYPFLSESTRLITSPMVKSTVRPGTPESELQRFATFGPPVDGAAEACFYHTFAPDPNGWAIACLFNPDLGADGLGVYVRYRTDTLPYFIQWKMLRSREYVCGLEPANAPLDSVDRTPDIVASVTLHPLEKRRYRLELGFVESVDALHNLVEKGHAHA